MTALSSRIEILVFPGSGFTTAPRFAREKSMSRCFSATTFLIPSPLTLARLPCLDHADNVWLPVRVHYDEQVADVAQTQGHEAALFDVGILTGQCEVIFESCNRLCETHAVGPQVRFCLPRIPLEPHIGSV